MTGALDDPRRGNGEPIAMTAEERCQSMEACYEAMTKAMQDLEPADGHGASPAVMERDARDSLATTELVLTQPAISLQLSDNLNASTHLPAKLTDLFLLSGILPAQAQVESAVAR
jgi:hypothetical protein